MKYEKCPVCLDYKLCTKHHVLPRELVKCLHKNIVWVCKPCHRKIHAEFTNMQLFTTDWAEVIETVRKKHLIQFQHAE